RFPSEARFNNDRERAKQRDGFYAAECKATSLNRKGSNKKADGGYGNRRDKAILAATTPRENWQFADHCSPPPPPFPSKHLSLSGYFVNPFSARELKLCGLLPKKTRVKRRVERLMVRELKWPIQDPTT
ncbi:hypothetical protein K0M31_018542, partial [Melipona bicolor]